MYHKLRSCLRRCAAGRVRVGELEARGHALEVADELVGDGPAQHRHERTQRLDRQARLLEIAALLREPNSSVVNAV